MRPLIHLTFLCSFALTAVPLAASSAAAQETAPAAPSSAATAVVPASPAPATTPAPASPAHATSPPTPAVVPAPSEPSEEPFHFEEQPRWNTVSAGFGTFGGMYILTAFFGGYLAGEPWFWVPVAGPLGYTAHYYSDHPCNLHCSDARWAYALAFVGSAAQAVGLVVGVYGLSTTERVKVYDDKPRVLVVPTLGAQGAGLSAVGTF